MPAAAAGTAPATSASEAASDLLISDFEDGTTQLARLGGRTGEWLLGNDGTATSMSSDQSIDCAVQGYRAGHFRYLGFTGWGANWTAYFVAQSGDAPVTYDIQGYSGISFWAAFGGGNPAPFPVRFTIVTIDTAYNSDICNPCNDHYTKKLTLTREWVHYTLSFDELKQGGNGVPQTPMKRDQAVGFMVWPAEPFDIWIDDVRFTR